MAVSSSSISNLNFNKVKEKIKNGYPKGTERSMTYGTAGFRGPANNLDWVMFRVGLLAVLRSKHQKGRAIGAMITASHNAIGDNGIKLIDPNGEMLDIAWESAATELVNAGDVDVIKVLNNIINRFTIDFSIPAIVYLAQDTRPSSDMLSTAVRDGVEAMGASVKDFHLLTTPQLHHIVSCQNRSFIEPGTDQPDKSSSSGALSTAQEPEDPSEEGYYSKTTQAFASLLRLRTSLRTSSDSSKSPYESDVYVDGANGIGAVKLAELRSRFSGLFDVSLPTVRIFNDGKDGVLNEGCGADFVKVMQKPPKGAPIAGALKYASFDGDADRLVYFYFDDKNVFHMLDGDKIATLLSIFFVELARESGLDLKIGVVQTAYANGASTNYIKDVLKMEVDCVPTGVKYLHQQAKSYDIGIYFEANGHGTVVFSDHANQLVSEFLAKTDNDLPTDQQLPLPGAESLTEGRSDEEAQPEEKNLQDLSVGSQKADTEFLESREKPADLETVDGAVNSKIYDSQPDSAKDISNARRAAEMLSLAGKVINQTVGDAIADLLIVEAILYLKGLSIKDWDALYQDLPNRQLKVKVQNREVVQTTDAERKCSAPSGLQTAIDGSVKKYTSARAFVRPSGTEDVVRVYAEADTQENADKLAQEVSYHVFQIAGGVGPAPPRPL